MFQRGIHKPYRSKALNRVFYKYIDQMVGVLSKVLNFGLFPIY